MRTCTLSPTKVDKTIEVSRLLRATGAVLVAVSAFPSANAQVSHTSEPTTQEARSFALTDLNDVIVTGGGKAETVEYQGRKAVRLTTQSDKDIFAFLKGVQIQDGTIESNIALKITTPPGVRMPGFVGIAFRARPDASRYELFCLRPGTRAPMTRRCGTMRVMRRIACPSFGHRFGRPSDSEPRCAPRPHSTS